MSCCDPARTRCAWCDAPIEVCFTAGRLDQAPTAVLCFPALWADGDNPQECWCPQANLFCREDHLEAWRSEHHAATARSSTSSPRPAVGLSGGDWH
jgi:hypothetical protein